MKLQKIGFSKWTGKFVLWDGSGLEVLRKCIDFIFITRKCIIVRAFQIILNCKISYVKKSICFEP